MIEITPQYLASQGLSESFPARFWAKVNKNGPVPPHRPELGPCWVWTAAKVEWGYGKIQRGDPFNGLIRAHVASWILEIGPIDSSLWVCHHCDNPPCCNPGHLFQGTQSENMRDCVSKGRYVRGECRGEANGRHKATVSTVIEIRRRYARNEATIRALCKEYGLGFTTILHIVHRDTWKHI